MDTDTEQQLITDKALALSRIELGEALRKLEYNPDFKLLLAHLEDKLKYISSTWARTSNSELLPVMQAILQFKNELSDIQHLANIAKADLQLIHDFETTDMED